MHIVTVTLTTDETHPEHAILPAVAVDLFWLSARPGDGLEHLHLHPVEFRADLTFFIRATTPAAAATAANAITQRAIGTAPTLRGWRIGHG
ncbi:hypothetical protein FCH28_13330 [Streptomyces piniterrae]|uniref:Uncharacterized protein n=1 Tax=Streptomyces piniterrae TaxID=2571125 RepID=A0A4U0NJB6_9ACTN|nr:hypothetical protein [Streptomyces piniterrae]TJZ54163.1 hypothetical protein FCH28_13330 [Streptomyces piniterrae]